MFCIDGGEARAEKGEKEREREEAGGRDGEREREREREREKDRKGKREITPSCRQPTEFTLALSLHLLRYQHLLQQRQQQLGILEPS